MRRLFDREPIRRRRFQERHRRRRLRRRRRRRPRRQLRRLHRDRRQERDVASVRMLAAVSEKRHDVGFGSGMSTRSDERQPEKNFARDSHRYFFFFSTEFEFVRKQFWGQFHETEAQSKFHLAEISQKF